MLRKHLGVIAGIIVGVIVVALVQFVGHQLFPLPAGIDPRDPEQLAAAMDQVPIGAKAMVLVAWFCGVLGGGIVGRLVGARLAWIAWVTAALLLGMTVASFFKIPHPTWMIVGAVVLHALGAQLAIWLTPARQSTL